jgi:hypothetical protein
MKHSYVLRRGVFAFVMSSAVLALWSRVPELQPFLPLLLYLVVGVATYDYQLLVPSDREQAQGGLDRSTRLTLAGFAFTSTSLVIGFFKEEIKAGDVGARAALFYLVLALACFVCGFLFLRYRMKRLFFHVDDALTDNGFWCVANGIVQFADSAGVASIVTAWRVVVAIYLLYLLLHFWCLVSFAERNRRKQAARSRRRLAPRAGWWARVPPVRCTTAPLAAANGATHLAAVGLWFAALFDDHLIDFVSFGASHLVGHVINVSF